VGDALIRLFTPQVATMYEQVLVPPARASILSLIVKLRLLLFVFVVFPRKEILAVSLSRSEGSL